MSKHICAVRGCGGALDVDRVVDQIITGARAEVLRCRRRPAHRYFVVEGRVPSKYNRLNDDTRWKK